MSAKEKGVLNSALNQFKKESFGHRFQLVGLMNYDGKDMGFITPVFIRVDGDYPANLYMQYGDDQTQKIESFMIVPDRGKVKFFPEVKSHCYKPISIDINSDPIYAFKTGSGDFDAVIGNMEKIKDYFSTIVAADGKVNDEIESFLLNAGSEK